ncbi:hypothetical protein B0T25DRAFT_548707 [Lasiosphaeria hispida]|uniref:Uncharacterized protein n=1 Tax=Lasiosphaeria hispida TaxID=260671 RepID=A0AAJ0HFL9_9PEZI|nr:hypothetical protein B0T25DRAFT_548707 [Lasiosphaeria hispida]
MLSGIFAEIRLHHNHESLPLEDSTPPQDDRSMADPLSIAAGVVGLVATAAKISKTLSDLCASVADAPESARAALVAVETTKLCLDTIKELFDTISTLPSERKALIRLDHIAVTCSQCVITLSELEELVCKQLLKNGGNIFDRIRWSWNEKRVLCLLPRLESQKSCIALMISVLQCQTWVDALKDSSRLDEAVDTMLRDDGDLAARIALSERGLEAETQSIILQDSRSTLRPAKYPESSSISLVEDSECEPPRLGDFECLLETSRPYRRAEPNEVDMMSTRGSTIRTVFSTLSFITMNDISIIAVYRLPITLNEITKIGKNLTFTGVLSEKQNPLSLRQNMYSTVPNRMPVKIVVIGDEESGTAELCRCYLSKSLEEGECDDEDDTHITSGQVSPIFPMGMQKYTTTISHKNRKYDVEIWDTSNLRNDKSQQTRLYAQTDVFIFCAGFPSSDSFENIQSKWLPVIQRQRRQVPFLVVGTVGKLGMEATKTMADNFFKQRRKLRGVSKARKYLQCNLVTSSGVTNVFNEALGAVLETKRLYQHYYPIQ